MQTASDALRQFNCRTRCPSLSDIVQLMELASVLGRRACGMPLDPADAPPAPSPLEPEWEAALRKIYGPKQTEANASPPVAPHESGA